jgi:sugar/nucleoside kinase (ribokinase family)
MTTAGVREIAVKNGRNSVALFTDGSLSRVPTPEVTNVRDTTGAGIL